MSEWLSIKEGKMYYPAFFFLKETMMGVKKTVNLPWLQKRVNLRKKIQPRKPQIVWRLGEGAHLHQDSPDEGFLDIPNQEHEGSTYQSPGKDCEHRGEVVLSTRQPRHLSHQVLRCGVASTTSKASNRNGSKAVLIVVTKGAASRFTIKSDKRIPLPEKGLGWMDSI